jgi:hypothetical protein
MPHQLLGWAIKQWIGLAMLSVMWGAGIALGETFCECDTRIQNSRPVAVNILDAGPERHEGVLLAGFGFQGPASSLITIRTYERHTGTVLAEESYDLNVQDEGTSTDAKQGRIFAGGMGLDREGRSRFLLRVYDALDGRFLWEGQLNLVPQKEERGARPIATVAPSRAGVWKAGIPQPVMVDVQFSLRAVDPETGKVVWEERFIPGTPMIGRVERIVSPRRSGQTDTIAHIFDLVVRAFDRTSGRLLWRDSFEDAAATGGQTETETEKVDPGAGPSWNQGRPVQTSFSEFGNVMNVGCGAWSENLQPIVVGTCRRTRAAYPAWPSQLFASP